MFPTSSKNLYIWTARSFGVIKQSPSEGEDEGRFDTAGVDDGLKEKAFVGDGENEDKSGTAKSTVELLLEVVLDVLLEAVLDVVLDVVLDMVLDVVLDDIVGGSVDGCKEELGDPVKSDVIVVISGGVGAIDSIMLGTELGLSDGIKLSTSLLLLGKLDGMSDFILKSRISPASNACSISNKPSSVSRYSYNSMYSFDLSSPF